MDMSEVFDRLKKLQTVLLRKNEVAAKINDAPNEVRQNEELLDRLKKEYVEKNTEFESLRKNINELKGEQFKMQLRREKAEKGMESVETQRDYETLEKSINDAKTEESRIRSILETQEAKFNALNEDIKEREKSIADYETEIAEKKNSLEMETSKMSTELKELDDEKAQYSEGLDTETIFKFERIIKSKLGNGIVPVKGGVCTGCNMILPSQFANEIRRETELKYCPYCSRVLYYAPADVDVDEFTFDENEIGGLADLDDV